jgi:tetratricopeptide (TPR) repeat protein
MSSAGSQRISSILASPRLHIVLILALGCLAYANSISVPLQLDDNQTLGNAWKNVASGWSFTAPGASRWLADVTFALNRTLHGFHPGGYHLLNLAIHLGAALLVYGLFSIILKQCAAHPSDSIEVPYLATFVPITTALLFVNHPIQTEAVTYIVQRYSSLATFFYLLALWLFFRARQAMTRSVLHVASVSAWWFGFTLAALCAMKCKQISMTLPLLTVLCEALFFRGVLLRKTAFVLLLTALFAVVPLQEISSRAALPNQSLSQQLQVASSETDQISRTSYFLTQQRVEATYLRLLLLPIKQNLDYDYRLSTSLNEPPVVAALLLHLSLLALAFALLIRSGKPSAQPLHETATAMRLLGFGIIWFYLTLAVESSFIPIRDVIYEHRLYLPSIGFFLAIASASGWLATRRPPLRTVTACVLAAILITLTTATIVRNRVWQSELGMWQDVIQKSPDKARSHFFAATFFVKQRLLDQAVENFVRAIELEPERDIYRIHLNDTIAMIDGLDQRSDSGSQYHSEREKIDPARKLPWRAVSLNNLGLAYELLNKPDQAYACFTEAVILNKNLAIAWLNLALLAGRLHDKSGEQQAKLRVEQLNPQLLQHLLPH